MLGWRDEYYIRDLENEIQDYRYIFAGIREVLIDVLKQQDILIGKMMTPKDAREAIEQYNQRKNA